MVKWSVESLVTLLFFSKAVEWCRSVGSAAETVDDIVKLKDSRVFFAITYQSP